MSDRYGISVEKWDAAKEEIRQILIERARTREMIDYSELVDQLTSITVGPYSDTLEAIMREISSEEDQHGRGMLSAVAVYMTGMLSPGPGPAFFMLARSLGRTISDRLSFWLEELKCVHDYWSDH